MAGLTLELINVFLTFNLFLNRLEDYSALVLLVGLPMKEAIGTSLLIIALNSLIGFTGDLGHFAIEWLLLIRITAIAIAGTFGGGYLNKKIDGSKLKKGFGWFVLTMGVYILARELFF